MSDGQKPSRQTASVREAEELLRRATHANNDPFLALSQSYRRKQGDQKLSPQLLEDDDDER